MLWGEMDHQEKTSPINKLDDLVAEITIERKSMNHPITTV